MTAPAVFRSLQDRLDEAERTLAALRADLAHARADEEISSTPTVAGIVPLAELERRAILHAVAAFEGNLVRAAQSLGIGKTTLYRKVRGILSPEELRQLRLRIPPLAAGGAQ